MAKVLNGSEGGKEKTNSTVRSRRRRRREVLSTPFAATCDGRLLLNAADCGGYDIRGREVFRGVVLTKAEMRTVFQVLGGGPLAEAASKILAKWPRRRRKGGRRKNVTKA